LVEEKMGDQKMAQGECNHHVMEIIEGEPYRQMFGKTKGVEETFCKRIKAWHNSTQKRQFNDLNVVKETRSPLLQRMRQDTIDVINRCLNPKNSIGMRGDYRQLGELGLVKLGEIDASTYVLKDIGAISSVRWSGSLMAGLKGDLLSKHVPTGHNYVLYLHGNRF
jgi:hypothetical protein